MTGAATAGYSPEVQERLASMRERLEMTDEGAPIYLHAMDCPSFCDYACNGGQHRNTVLDELAWLLARIPPTTGSSAVAAPEDAP